VEVKILFYILIIFSIVIPQNIYGQTITSESEFDLGDAELSWEPVQMEISAGSLKLNVWILPSMMPSPEPGYLLTKSDFIKLKSTIDSFQEEIDLVKSKERSHCDEMLKEKDVFCQNLNKDLIRQIDAQKLTINKNISKINGLNKELLWTKIISGSVVLGISMFTIYAISK
jgi:hypothetical protein